MENIQRREKRERAQEFFQNLSHYFESKGICTLREIEGSENQDVHALYQLTERSHEGLLIRYCTGLNTNLFYISLVDYDQVIGSRRNRIHLGDNHEATILAPSERIILPLPFKPETFELKVESLKEKYPSLEYLCS